MKNLAKRSFVVSAALVATVPLFAFAQLSTVVPPSYNAPLNSVTSIITLINIILFWVATLFWIAAAGFIFYAAFTYLTAAGDEEKVKSASHMLLYAVVAIAVGIMAYGLPVLVNAFLGGK